MFVDDAGFFPLQATKKMARQKFEDPNNQLLCGQTRVKQPQSHLAVLGLMTSQGKVHLDKVGMKQK